MQAKATQIEISTALPFNWFGRLLVGSVVSVNNRQWHQALGPRGCAVRGRQWRASPGYAIEFVEQDERAETFWGISFPPSTSNA